MFIVPDPPDLGEILPTKNVLLTEHLLPTPESECSVIANCPDMGWIFGGLSPSHYKEASPSTLETQKLRTASELGS
jgi:hypothetical protein